MKPLKLTIRTVLVAALMIIVVAAAFDGLRQYTKVNPERNKPTPQVQVEPARAPRSSRHTPAI